MFSTRVHLPNAAARRRWSIPVAGSLLLAVAATAAAEPQPPPGGAVAALQDILRQEAGPDLAARRTKINQLVAQMDLEELSRVLLLPDWSTLELEIAGAKSEADKARILGDLQLRSAAAERFRDKAKEAIKAAKEAPAGNTRQERADAMLAKAATADLIGETAAAGRKLDYLAQIPGPRTPSNQQSQIGYLAQQLSELTPGLIDLAKFNDATVPEASALARRSAARALGEIQPANPTQVIGALEEMLADKNNSLDLRLAAAGSMDELAQAAAKEMQHSLGPDEAVQNRFLDFAQAVWLAVLRHGLAADQPAEVRLVCLHAFSRVASEMLELSVVPETNPTPPKDLDPKLIKDIEDRWNLYFQRLAAIFGDFQKNAAPLAAAVGDDDPEVRRAALTTLVDLANLRGRLQRLAAGATALPSPEPGHGGPTPTEGKKIPPEAARDLGAALILIAADEPPREKSQQQAFQDLAGGIDKAIPALTAQLRSPDVETRRLAMDALEGLGTGAIPAVDGIVGSLGDPDRFVRWAAARTLGKLAQAENDKQKLTTAQASAAVGGIAELLRDEDVGVRLAALTSLQHFGPRAAPAAPILSRMINRSQTEASLAIFLTPDTDPDLVKGDPTVRVNAFAAL